MTARRRVTVLIPAHNEAHGIGDAVESVHAQTRAVDRIIVIADNCTDGTEAVAAAIDRVEVLRTVGNRHKKAGALNQTLERLLDKADASDLVLVMDADSFLDPDFVAVAEEWLTRDGDVTYGGIGGTFRGRPGEVARRAGMSGVMQRWVETVQCNEYVRYARDVNRKRGRVLVLTGTATLFSVTALRDVVTARRAGRLPGGADAGVYDTAVLTEDNELTFALRHLGYAVRSPKGCTLTTEVMPTWADLYRQRMRWKRGAMENLAQYGLTRITAKYWGYQVVMFLGIVVTALYLGTVTWVLAVQHGMRMQLLWLGITVVFAVERAVTVRARGWRHVAGAAVLLVEMPYDIFLQATHTKALVDALRGKARNW